MKNVFKVMLVVLGIFLLSGIVFSQSEVIIYYPTPYEYPDSNIMSDDLELSNYYNKGKSSEYDVSATGVDGGYQGYPERNSGNNSIGVFDKIFSKDSGEISGDEFIRAYSKVFFVNAVPDVDYVAVWLDGTLLAPSLPFSTVTNPISIPPGNVPYSVEIAGKNVIEDTLNLEAGIEHMVFITGLYGISTGQSIYKDKSFKLKATLVKENPLADDSNAGISFYNSVPSNVNKSLDLRVGKDKENKKALFKDVPYGEYITSKTLDPGNYIIDIISGNGGKVKKLTKDLSISLIAGTKYFAVAFPPRNYGLPEYEEE